MTTTPLTKEQFVRQYAENSGKTEAEALANHVALPCRCDAPQCRGWAMVLNLPSFIESHNELYGEPNQ